MKEDLLPVGSVVLLKNAEKRIVVTGYGQVNEKNELFDYSAIYFPEGMLNSKKVMLFNHDQIEQIFFKGYVDQEQLDFMLKITPILEKAKTEGIDSVKNKKDDAKEQDVAPIDF